MADDSGNGLELSALRVQFQVNHWTMETPNTLVARIYNPASQTVNRINKEFTQVVVQAGYDGQYGRIFQGTIKQTKRGRESAVDTYLDIFAGDADVSHNWSVINRSLAAGWTAEHQRQACLQAFGQTGQTTDGHTTTGLSANPAPRGCVLFGMTRDPMRDLAQTHDMTWNLNNNQLNMVAQSAYLPGQMVVTNSATGMLGIPEMTQEGLTVRMLMNPNVGVDSLLQINNADVTQYLKPNVVTGMENSSVTLPLSLDADGIYKVVFVDHVGDTRGNDWETRCICWALRGENAIPKTAQALQTTATIGPTTPQTMKDESGNVMTDESGNVLQTNK